METEYKCEKCGGTGKIQKRVSCAECQGLGSKRILLDPGKGPTPSPSSKPEDACKACEGRGFHEKEIECYVCHGAGKTKNPPHSRERRSPRSGGAGHYQPHQRKMVSLEPIENATVYKFESPTTPELASQDMIFLGKVLNKRDVGVFVDLGTGIRLLVPRSKIPSTDLFEEGEETLVQVMEIKDGKLYGVFRKVLSYEVEMLSLKSNAIKIAQISKTNRGKFVAFQGIVRSIRETSGPTTFTFKDETGSIIGIFYATRKGKRPFPNIKEKMIVDVVGRASFYRNQLQVDLHELTPISEEEVKLFEQRMADALQAKAQPADVPLLVETDLLKELHPKLREAAAKIIEAIIVGNPIRIRHHQCPDGIAGALALQTAIEHYIDNQKLSADSTRFRIRRIPINSPYLDVFDIARDIEGLKHDQERLGGKKFLYVILDAGSSKECLPAYEHLRAFNVDVVVLDHHLPDVETQNMVNVMVAPDSGAGPYYLSCGILGVEVARLIAPDVADKIEHFAAVAGTNDHIHIEALAPYLELAAKKGYDQALIDDLVFTLDYESHYLRTSDGRHILQFVLGIADHNQEGQKEFIKSIAAMAREQLKKGKDLAISTVNDDSLQNGIKFVEFEAVSFIKRGYPNSRRLTEAVHEHFRSQEEGTPLVTVGKGSEFVVYFATGTGVDFPTLLKQIADSNPTFGLEGGGHNSDGLLRCYPGKTDDLLAAMKAGISQLGGNQ